MNFFFIWLGSITFCDELNCIKSNGYRICYAIQFKPTSWCLHSNPSILFSVSLSLFPLQIRIVWFGSIRNTRKLLMLIWHHDFFCLSPILYSQLLQFTIFLVKRMLITASASDTYLSNAKNRCGTWTANVHRRIGKQRQKMETTRLRTFARAKMRSFF